jgi:hypothetical protein
VAGCCVCGDDPSGSCATELVRPLKIYQCTKCHGPMLTGASFVSTSEV